ncbi:MAG: ATP-binding cassette domain-containing protein [Chloroflexi bacterium]|nr:ATP-binding cassette domain-containing protein [Chloroflexota bacterium]
MMAAQPMIEVEQLVRRFDDFEAVRGVTFEVGEGELFGFLGPNGAGKTTTINMLVTVLRPSSGEARVAGYSVREEPRSVRESIGIVFQDTTLDDSLTGWENLRFHADVYDIPTKLFRERAEEVLQTVELENRRDDLVRNYSGGMKRRLEIARGLLHYPKVLFLDEPTLGLDPQSRIALWDYIRAIQQREKITVFLTTHYMAEAEYCDRIAIIDHGEIVALDTPARLKESVGGDVVTLTTSDNLRAGVELEELHLQPRIEDGLIRFEAPEGAVTVANVFRHLTPEILSVDLHKPSLEDVFIHLTGREIRDDEASSADKMRSQMRSGGIIGPGGRRMS